MALSTPNLEMCLSQPNDPDPDHMFMSGVKGIFVILSNNPDETQLEGKFTTLLPDAGHHMQAEHLKEAPIHATNAVVLNQLY